jgi:carboxyl-terminal processing protease
MLHKYLFIFLAFLVIGCSHVGKTQIEINQVKRTGIKDGEAIVVLSETKTFWGYDEKKLGKCTSRAFEKLNRNIKIFPSDKFRRIYFSNHNLSDDYSTKEALRSIFTNEEILKRIESSNIHYLILARLDTQDYVYNRMDILIYAEAHAKEETRVFGEVYDIKSRTESGEIATHVDAEWVNRAIMHLPGRFIIPVHLGYGATESEACKAFGEGVAKFLIGDETSDYTKAVELNPTRVKYRHERAIPDYNHDIELNPSRIKDRHDGVNLIDQAYHLIIKEYYKPISGSTLLYGSVKGIESLVGDTGCVIIENGYPKILNPLTQKLLDPNVTREEGLQTLKEIYKFIVNNKRDFDSVNIAHSAIGGMLESIGAKPILYKSDYLESFPKGPAGIGINMTIQDGFVTVISPIEDTPADKAGIITQDRIVKIDGKPLKELSEAVNMMRGQEGSKVLVTIVRQGEKEPLEFELVRDVIPSISVKAIELKPGYYYIHLTQFSGSTTRELEAALKKMETSGVPVRGLVLDLRNNSGGLLNQAIMVSDLFLEEGKIVSIKGRVRKNRKIYLATPNSIKHSYSMIVLINEISAAASEIVAGALQDQKRALILGTKSYGLGSIDAVETLHDGSGIRLTIATCYTPKGRSIQDEAIEPDIVVKRNFDSEFDYFFNDNQLFKKEGPGKSFSIKKKLEVDNQVKNALEILIYR